MFHNFFDTGITIPAGTYQLKVNTRITWKQYVKYVQS